MSRVLPYGERALLVDGVAEPLQLVERLRGLPGLPVEDLVPGACTVLMKLAQGASSDEVSETLTTLLGGKDRPATPGAAGPTVEVPVSYDGQDLHAVAEHAGTSVEEVVRRHVGASYEVAFVGFTPGFGYLRGLDPVLHVPRRDAPRTAVPPGSVAVAGPWTGVYPRESPGGWQLLGRTDLVLWDLDGDPPALLRPGVRVRFRAVRG